MADLAAGGGPGHRRARGERWSEARVGTPGRGRQGSGADPHQGDAGADVGRRRADSDLAAPFVLGTLALNPAVATSFIDPVGRLEVDAPAGAVTAADAAAAGGGLALRIIQLAAGAGANAGGSGIVSFGTYLVQLVDPHGRLVGHGLRRPLTMTLRLERAASALDLRHAFVVVNWLRPTTLTTRVAATATSAADPAAARPAAVPAGQLALGRSAHLPAALVREAGAADPAGRLARHGSQAGPDTTLSPLALVVHLLLPSPSSAISWNTSGAIAYFGKPDLFNADLSAGSLSGSLPIDVPAGPGGLTPPLSLAYGSAGVAENHSVQGAAGWVGEGWTMSLGAINWSEHNISANCRTCAPAWASSWQLSDPYGTGAEIIPPSTNVATYYDDTGNNYCALGVPSCPIYWHTANESYAKIVEYQGPLSLGSAEPHPPCFRVWLKNGIMEEFGCTAGAIEHYVTDNPGAGGYVDYVSGWLLDLITDPQGNQIQVTYQADTATDPSSGYSYTRDIELSTIAWDSPGCHNAQAACTGSAWAPQMEVVFQAAHAPVRPSPIPNPTSYTTCNTGTHLRCDDPLDHSGSGGLAAPAVQSTFVLNEIDVHVRTSGTGPWEPLRTYQLGYEQSGPHDQVDPVTGETQSVAGLLDLIQFQEISGNGVGGVALPMRTFTYSSQLEYYEDDTWAPNVNAGCGPSWNTGDASSNGCVLWSESNTGNERFLASAANGMGLAQTFSWADARNNTHGVNGGGSNAEDPLYCNGKESQGYPCDLTDDQDWSHVVLTQENGKVLRVSQSGQGASMSNSQCPGGSVTCGTVQTTTGYTYRLTQFTGPTECADCTQGMYWGNQNEGDYLDYYNGKFMGFVEATVSLPNGALAIHRYDATAGWGVYATSGEPINCLTNNMYKGQTTCNISPWWSVTNAAHGHEVESDLFDTDGVHLLRATTTGYAAVCPPANVTGSPASGTYGDFKGQRVSELDGDNPVAVCDVQTTQVYTYTYDDDCAPAIPGSGNGWSAASECAPSVSTHASAADSYDQYGAVTTADRQSDGGSPYQIQDLTTYNSNDAVNASAYGATGTYLIDVPAYTAEEDGGATTRTGCVERGYDGAPYTCKPSGQNLATLTAGLLTSTTRFSGSCGTSGTGWAPSGPIATTTGYDPYGDPMGTTDGDANAGDATHLGCTANGVTFSACTGYDGTYAALPASGTNALGQSETTGYTLTTGGGFGLWATSTTDKNGHSTAYAYDLLGRMTARTLPGDSVQTTTWAYDDWCQSSAAIVQAACVEVIQTQHLTSTATVETRAFYDGYGRLVETRAQAPGSQDVVRYRYYDAAGAVEHDSVAYFVADTGTCGCASDFSIPDSTQAGTGTSYDGAGRVTSTTDAASHVTTTAYTVTTGLNGDTGDYEQTAVVDPLGHQTATLTDAFGRAGYAERYTGSAAPYSLYASTKYYYNLDGTLASILQPGGASTSFSYDSAGRQTGLTDPDRGSETYTYDADGNRLSSVDARGAAGTVWAGYDPLDRQTWRNTTNSPTNAYVTYTYDSTAGGNNGVGHLTNERFLGAPGGPNQGLAGNYAYSYDPRGQQTSETLTLAGNTYTVGTSYDDAGNVTAVASPDGETVSYDVDSQAGWLAGVTDLNGSTQTNLLSNASYTGSGGAAGDLTGASLGNGVYTYAAGYDLLVRPTTTLLTRTSTGATEYYQSRTYDAGSNLSALRTDLQGQTDDQAFCYDEQDRLTWASTASGATPCGGTNPTGTLTSAAYTQSFGYDTLGRLTTGPLGAYSYGNSAHLHAATSIGGTWTAAYDAASDMTCRAATSANTCAGGSPTGSPLTWDTEGRLVEWTSPTGAPWASSIDLYDGEGNRVQQQTVSGGVTTQTYYIGNLEEVSVSGTQTTTTTYYYAGNGGPRIATATNGVFSYLASDTLGTAEVALDASGNTTAAQLYAPYGTTRYSSGTMPGSYGYTGQRADAVTGLDYYGARYYDSTAEQFVSGDTVLPGKGYDVWGLSRYAYVAGNPISRADPSGHCPWCIAAFVGGVIIAGGLDAVAQYQSNGGNWGQVNWGEAATVGVTAGVTAAIVVAMPALLVPVLAGGGMGAVEGLFAGIRSGDHMSQQGDASPGSPIGRLARDMLIGGVTGAFGAAVTGDLGGGAVANAVGNVAANVTGQLAAGGPFDAGSTAIAGFTGLWASGLTNSDDGDISKAIIATGADFLTQSGYFGLEFGLKQLSSGMGWPGYREAPRRNVFAPPGTSGGATHAGWQAG